MSLIIDGYNLLHASGLLGRGIGPGGLERSRRALLNFLVASIDPDELARSVVVFDASRTETGRRGRMDHRGLAVHFATEHEDADELIEVLIRADSAPRRLTVVSSDHRIQRAARRRRATAVDSAAWYHEMVRRRLEHARATTDDAAKPPAPAAPYEVDFWLREFADVDNDTLPDRVDEPFPPGYGEDLFDELDPPGR